MAKAKFDFKALALNHFEKVGAGLVALLGIYSLASASWNACNLDPGQLQRDADNTRSQWLSSTLPLEDRAKFQNTPDAAGMARKMSSSLEQTGAYATLRRWNDPLKEISTKAESVTVLAAMYPESSLVIFPLVEREEELEEEADDEAEAPARGRDKPEENTEDLEKLFGRSKTGNQLAGGPGGLGDSGGLGLGGTGGLSGPGGLGGAGGLSGPGGLGGAGGLSGPGGLGGAGGLSGPGGLGGGKLGSGGMGSFPGEGYGDDYGEDSGDPYGGLGMGDFAGMGDYGGMGMQAGLEKKKVRSHAGVSVRYVFDLYEQAQQIANALNVSGQAGVSYVDFVDLEIQRKRSVPGADPWTGEWEDLSIDDVGEILNDSLGADLEIVNPSVTRAEITMPLPRRAAGEWTPADASHDRLDNFALSKREQELINAWNEKLREEAGKVNAKLPPQQAKSQGFRQFGIDSTDLYGGLSNAGYGGEDQFGGMMDDFYSNEDQQEQTGDDEESREDMERQIRNSMAIQRILLVRFMDFTCERGAAYIYRVRLEMRNPNFNRPVEMLVDPEVASRPTLFSDWSDPTQAIYVPAGYRYYPDKIESRARADEYAAMSMYYEHETAGTPLLANVRVPVGTRIGGRESVEVVDLSESTLEMSDVEIRSDDFLAAVTEAPRLSRGDFPELRDLFAALGNVRPVGDRVTIVDGSGRILSRYVGDRVDIGTREVSKADDVRLTKFVLDTYDYMRPQSESELTSPYGDEGGLGGLGGSGDYGGSGMFGGDGSGMNFGGGMGRGSSMSGASGRRGSRGSRGGKGGESGF